jgi:hypothetical protein
VDVIAIVVVDDDADVADDVVVAPYATVVFYASIVVVVDEATIVADVLDCECVVVIVDVASHSRAISHYPYMLFWIFLVCL